MIKLPRSKTTVALCIAVSLILCFTAVSIFMPSHNPTLASISSASSAGSTGMFASVYYWFFPKDQFEDMAPADPRLSTHVADAYRFHTPFRAPAAGGPAPRFVLISLIDDRNLGTYHATIASRMCYCQMHRDMCMSVIYTERDLPGWTPEGLHDRYTRLTWSRIFLYRRTAQLFNLTEKTWIIWFDADIVLTNPRVTLDEIVHNASRVLGPPQAPLATTTPAAAKRPIAYEDEEPVSEDGYDGEPSLLVCDQHNGVNAGLVGLRMTRWGRRFLERWWRDRDAMRVLMDNGALMHALLREQALARGVQYRGECAQFLPAISGTAAKLRTRNADCRDPTVNRCDRKHGCDSWEKYWHCHQDYLVRVVCGGRPEACMNRVPHAERPWDSAWDAGAVLGRDYEYGFLVRDAVGRHIATHPKINAGIKFGKCAEFDPSSSWLLHLAGGPGKKLTLMTEWMLRTADRFSPRCY